MAPELTAPARHTVFIGFMGAGKSTAARAADPDALDVDALVEARLGKPIDRVFAEDGEDAFRAVEAEVTLEALARPEPRVLALGGGAVMHPVIRAALAAHRVVWLDVAVELAWSRTRGGERPLARDHDAFARRHDEREPVYAALADAIVPGTRAGSIRPILEALTECPDGARMLWATSESGDYPVFIGSGLLEQGFWPATVAGRRFVVTDGAVGRLYGERIPDAVGRVAIMPGEASKTIAHAEIVWTELARAGLTRRDVVVALGGGVVGDLAGFCAATYQRGVRFVGVPTTLVAQVDSAYGGKTGVDLEEAKNYVGAFHQPSAVIADTDALATLPAEEVAAGYAEVVKTALIAGGSLWERVRSGAEPTDPAVITACALTKLRVVAQDERDGGLRQLLNLGHTVGHAIETVTRYTAYRHGEAVGLGLLAALRLSGRPELREEVGDLLAARGLPTRLELADPDAVVMATARDKKRVGEGPVPFVLVEAPGVVHHGQTVSNADLIAAVRELAAS